MKPLLYIFSIIVLFTACQDDPGKILASSDDPHEIKKALHQLGQDTTKAAPEGLKEGTQAPYFAATDQEARPISLSNLTKEGKVVLFFYRGYWCSICNRYLSDFQDSLSLITATGANVVAVAPETASYQERTILKNNLKITVISDTKQTIMNQYKVAFDVNKKYEKRIGIDLKEVNGGAAVLPVPATYIIGEDGNIIKTFFNPVFSKRPSIKEIVAVLEQ